MILGPRVRGDGAAQHRARARPALPASPLGKVKMVAQVAAILILILGRGTCASFFVLGQVALWIATIAALVSAVDYCAAVQRVLIAEPAAVAGRRRRPRCGPADARGAASRATASALDLREPLLGAFQVLARP